MDDDVQVRVLFAVLLFCYLFVNKDNYRDLFLSLSDFDVVPITSEKRVQSSQVIHFDTITFLTS